MGIRIYRVVVLRGYSPEAEYKAFRQPNCPGIGRDILAGTFRTFGTFRLFFPFKNKCHRRDIAGT
jgi:hypothetical protein